MPKEDFENQHLIYLGFYSYNTTSFILDTTSSGYSIDVSNL